MPRPCGRVGPLMGSHSICWTRTNPVPHPKAGSPRRAYEYLPGRKDEAAAREGPRNGRNARFEATFPFPLAKTHTERLTASPSGARARLQLWRIDTSIL